MVYFCGLFDETAETVLLGVSECFITF